jgi:hypothetical protein
MVWPQHLLDRLLSILRVVVIRVYVSAQLRGAACETLLNRMGYADGLEGRDTMRRSEGNVAFRMKVLQASAGQLYA